MAMERIYVTTPQVVLKGAHQGENLARCICFPIDGLKEQYGEGTWTIVFRRPFEADPYVVANQEEVGNYAAWGMDATDTAVAGEGRVELRYYVDDTLCKTDVYAVLILPSLGETGDAPSPYEDIIDTVAGYAAEARDAADEAGSVVSDAVAELQAELDQAISGVTVDSEVINARVDADGTTYSTLKQRLDAENTDLKNHLGNVVNDTMEIISVSESITPTIITASGSMNTSGVVGTGNYLHTNIISVKKGDVITPPSSSYSFRFVTAFSGNDAVSASGAENVNSYTVPSGVDGVVISYKTSYTDMVITIITSEDSYKVTGLSELEDRVEALEDNSYSQLITERDSYDVTFIEPTYSPYEMNTSGTIGSNSAYKHTEKISVQQGDIITIYKDNMTRSAFDNNSYTMRFVTAFNGDVAVSSKGASNVGTYTVPDGIDGIVVCVYTKNSSQDHEQQIRRSKPIKEDFTNSFNILSNKKWVACGDSFTAAGYDNTDGVPFNEYTFATGRFAGKNRTYPWIIGLRNNMDIVNMAVSGMSMANSTESNAFVLDDYYKGIPSDADYITLKFGINDLNHGTVIGSIDSTDTATFYGAWNTVMSYIVNNYPLAKIGIIVTNGLNSANAYADAIIAIAKKWGVPYLDEVYDDKVPLLHRVDRPNVASEVKQKKLETFRVSVTNTHPNVNAQYYESAFVENWLKTL